MGTCTFGIIHTDAQMLFELKVDKAQTYLSHKNKSPSQAKF